MRSRGFLVIACLVTGPVLAEPILYTFDVTDGYLRIYPQAPCYEEVPLAGTFSLMIQDDDGHLGESDWAWPEDAHLTNTEEAALSIAGLATAHVYPGSARLLDFDLDPNAGAAHLGAGGTGVAEADAFLSATAVVTGVIEDTFSMDFWAGEPLPVGLTFTTSVTGSDTLVARLHGSIPYVLGIPDFGMTVTLDFVINVEGTAHVVPDPALGGLTVLGLAGAGAWLRRRRDARRG